LFQSPINISKVLRINEFSSDVLFLSFAALIHTAIMLGDFLGVFMSWGGAFQKVLSKNNKTKNKQRNTQHQTNIRKHLPSSCSFFHFLKRIKICLNNFLMKVISFFFPTVLWI